ncbi:class IIb bacteriocin, lactobin A/cerein 7B family [Colwelliaceae bacterium MEBiC 14330]
MKELNTVEVQDVNGGAVILAAAILGLVTGYAAVRIARS